MTYPYGSEYQSGRLFWGEEPGRAVRIFSEAHTIPDAVLDLGCGEGKNSIFLARRAKRVVATDASTSALENFLLQPGYPELAARIDRVQADARYTHFNRRPFGLVVAYGLLHCFEHSRIAFQVVSRMITWTQPGGYHIVAALTDNIPLGTRVHPYLKPAGLIPLDTLLEAYHGQTITWQEQDVLIETHPTSNIEHRHSIIRVIARITA